MHLIFFPFCYFSVVFDVLKDDEFIEKETDRQMTLNSISKSIYDCIPLALCLYFLDDGMWATVSHLLQDKLQIRNFKSMTFLFLYFLSFISLLIHALFHSFLLQFELQSCICHGGYQKGHIDIEYH